MNLKTAMEKLKSGESVEGRPHGNSMRPLIKSGDLVHIEPVGDVVVPRVGDAVLAKVGGRLWLHKVDRIGPDGRFLITNMGGHPNGWAKEIFGVVTHVQGLPIRRT